MSRQPDLVFRSAVHTWKAWTFPAHTRAIMQFGEPIRAQFGNLTLLTKSPRNWFFKLFFVANPVYVYCSGSIIKKDDTRIEMMRVCLGLQAQVRVNCRLLDPIEAFWMTDFNQRLGYYTPSWDGHDAFVRHIHNNYVTVTPTFSPKADPS